MILIAAIPIAVAVTAGAAHAATPDYPVSFYAGLGGAMGPAVTTELSVVAAHGGEDETSATATVADGGLSGGGWGLVRSTVNYQRVALDLGLRSGVMADDLREIGAISAGFRYAPGLPYFRVGFVHHHETPWETFKSDPLLSVIGSAEGIRHRSGGDLAIGLAGALNPVELPEQRLRAFVELSVVGFPDDNGPHVYGTLDFGFGVSLGRDRSQG